MYGERGVSKLLLAAATSEHQNGIIDCLSSSRDWEDEQQESMDIRLLNSRDDALHIWCVLSQLVLALD